MAKKRSGQARTTDDPGMLRDILDGSTEVIEHFRSLAREAGNRAGDEWAIAFNGLDEFCRELIALTEDRRSPGASDLATDVAEVLSMKARLSL